MHFLKKGYRNANAEETTSLDNILTPMELLMDVA